MSRLPADPGSAWWRQALVTFASEARQTLRRRFPSISHAHDDLLSEAVVNLTAHLQRRPADAPAAWFEPTAPGEEAEQRFQQLAFTVLNRRVADYFRSHYRQLAFRVDDSDAEDESASPEPDAGSALDLRRAAHALLIAMAALPEADRALLESTVLGGNDPPRTDRDRQRLRRLRASLLQELRTKLRCDPLALIRKL